MGKKRNVYRIWVGKPEGKRSLGRPRYGWKDNQMVPRKTGWGGKEWINLAQDRDQCEHGNEPSGSIECWEILEWLRDW
jgi:hypothetical protein